METDSLRKSIRLYNFPSYLDHGVRFDRVNQTRPQTTCVKSEDAGASAEIDHDIAGLHRKRESLAISACANAVRYHRSVRGKVVKMH
jgi:hypothetical protein